MGRAETLAAVREKYPMYKDMTDVQLGTALAAKYPEYKDLAPHPWVAVTEAGLKGTPIPGTENLTPPGELLLNVASIPLVTAGGAGAGALASRAPQALRAVAPAVGRIATQAGISRARGEDLPHTLVDVGGAIVGETAAAGVGKVAKQFAEPAQALQWIRDRVGRGKDAAVNLAHVDRLMDWWQKAPTAPAKEAAGDYVVKALKESFGAAVSQMFRRNIMRASVRVPGAPMLRGRVPFGMSEKAATVYEASKSPVTRATIDAFLGTPPFSAVAVGAMEKLAKPALRHVPGGREVSEVIEEAAE